MADYTIIGDLVVLELSIPIVDPQDGLFWKQVFVGPQDALITQQQLLNIQSDQRVTLERRNGPIYELTVITPDYINGQSNALNKYELITHEVEKGIMDHPLAVANLSSISRWEINKWIKDKEENPVFTNDTEAIVYNKMLLGGGTAKFLDFERTFRYSIVTSARFGTLVSESNVKKLWTAAQIIAPSFSGIIFPPGIRFDLLVVDSSAPGDVTKTIKANTIADPTRVISEIYKWRWLKMGAQVENQPNGKLRITQEWMGDLWSTWEYAAAT